jgi:hypothetical protein
MQSSLISKIEKARVYSGERHRMEIDGLHVSFHGENSDHDVTLRDGQWACNCGFFAEWGTCSHTMALQRTLMGMVPEASLPQLQPA